MRGHEWAESYPSTDLEALTRAFSCCSALCLKKADIETSSIGSAIGLLTSDNIVSDS